MGIKYEQVFWVITAGVVIACAISFLYLMSISRSAGVQSAQEGYYRFTDEWESRFHMDIEKSSVLSASSNFLTWFTSFVELNPRIQSIEVTADTGSRMFSWQRSATNSSEITQAALGNRKVRFFDYPTELHVTMRAEVITQSDFIQIFRIMGYFVIAYVVFLLMFHFGGVSHSRKTAFPAPHTDLQTPINEENSQLSDDEIQPVESASTYYSDLQIRLRTELDLSAQQEKDMCLLILHTFPIANTDRTTIDWLTERFIYRDLIFSLGGDRYAIILPDSTITQGVSEANSTITLWSETAYAGVTSRGGRLIDPERFIREAIVCLKKAHTTGKQVVGFHPDPQKYRQFIANSIS